VTTQSGVEVELRSARLAYCMLIWLAASQGRPVIVLQFKPPTCLLGWGQGANKETNKAYSYRIYVRV